MLVVIVLGCLGFYCVSSAICINMYGDDCPAEYSIQPYIVVNFNKRRSCSFHHTL